MAGMHDGLERQRALVAANPDQELARFSLGKALLDRGAYAEAQEHLEVALKRRPDWMVVQILLGRCALAQGDRDGARRAFERGLELAVQQQHEGPEAEMREMLEELGDA